MYLKKLVLVATFISLAFAFSLSAYAMPADDDNSFFDTFAIDQHELAVSADEDNVGFYTVSNDGKSTLETKDVDLDDYGIFSLNKGYSRLSVFTFADTKVFTGNGEEGTTVGILVFNVKDGEIIPTYRTDETVIGASGLYNASISLEIGANSVLIAVKKDDVFVYRLFKVTVKEEITKGILENIQLNFIQPSKVTTELKSSSFAPTMGTYSIPVKTNTTTVK